MSGTSSFPDGSPTANSNSASTRQTVSYAPAAARVSVLGKRTEVEKLIDTVVLLILIETVPRNEGLIQRCEETRARELLKQLVGDLGVEEGRRISVLIIIVKIIIIHVVVSTGDFGVFLLLVLVVLVR